MSLLATATEKKYLSVTWHRYYEKCIDISLRLPDELENFDGSDDALLTVSTGIPSEEVDTIETIEDATQFNDVKYFDDYK